MSTNRKNMVETLEGRQLLASTVQLGIIQMYNKVNSDGSRSNQQDIVFNFTGNVTVGNKDLFGIRGSGINPLSGRQKKFIIPIVSAVNGPNPNQITVTTGSLNRKNGRVFVYAGAVKDSTNQDVVVDDSAPARNLPRGENKERFTLAQRSFSPFDFTLFSNDRYPTGGVAEATLNTQPSSGTVRAALDTFLGKKVTAGTINQAKKDSTMAQYDNATVSAIVLDPNLRAGLLSLVGTVSEPAINHYIGTANATGRAATVVAFDGSQFSNSARIAETTKTNGRFKTIFNPNYAGEPFQILGAMLAHETTHVSSDFINSQDEEVVANFIEIGTYAQQVEIDAGVLRTGSILSTRMNYRLLLLMNSGKKQFPRVGVASASLKAGNNGSAPGSFPEFGTTPIASFDADVRAEMAGRNVADKPPTEGNVTTWAILKNITGRDFGTATRTNESKFGDLMVAEIDQYQGILGDRGVINLAGKLKLVV